MKIVILGSGNLATHLSLALKAADCDIVQVFSRTLVHGRALAHQLGCSYTNRTDDIRDDADVYIFSVKDDALATLITYVCRKGSDALFLHTAGSMPMTVFEGQTSHFGVLYPMQTFSKARPVEFREIPCFIEASDAQSLKTIRSLAERISARVVDCDSEKRKKLHLAAVFACNLTNHCYRLAERLLESEQIDFRLFHPLIEETARKVMTMSPKNAQTGPMVRYDQNVMNMQMSMLPDARTREIYRLMAESIHEDY